MLKYILTALVVAAIGIVLFVNRGSANDQIADGTYKFDSVEDTYDGSAGVVEVGTSIHLVTIHGKGSVWIWNEAEKAYLQVANPDWKLMAEKGGEGEYAWEILDTSANQSIDKGSATLES
tara:strand:+ start:549 stop:908 length:360 start_codon:yes stop_codon:yes gene_type:complete